MSALIGNNPQVEAGEQSAQVTDGAKSGNGTAARGAVSSGAAGGEDEQVARRITRSQSREKDLQSSGGRTRSSAAAAQAQPGAGSSSGTGSNKRRSRKAE